MIEEAGQLALRRGEWKYIKPRGGKRKRGPAKAQLFNLKIDIGEQNNVIEEHPEIAKDMDALLQKLVDDKRVRPPAGS